MIAGAGLGCSMGAAGACSGGDIGGVGYSGAGYGASGYSPTGSGKPTGAGGVDGASDVMGCGVVSPDLMVSIILTGRRGSASASAKGLKRTSRKLISSLAGAFPASAMTAFSERTVNESFSP